ncbi:MAG TPA: alginate lyase family protein [Gemmatimonadales bacterium]|nr:alginate lyase family protein [Gemmatimonadales bacterium]
MLDRAALYLRTLAPLKGSQLVYLPLRRLQRMTRARPVLARRPPGTGPVDALARALRAMGPGDESARLATAAAVLAGRFRFLNHEERLERIDWTRRQVSHLWSYNLHYFDYAVDLAWAHLLTGRREFADRFVELARGWIEGTRSGRGDGWEPYAVSVRIVNWIGALLLLGSAVEPAARQRLHRSLAAQLRWLERRLERHLLANHLQKNYLALAIGGLYLAGRDAERWRAAGVDGLWRELEEQVLPDGAHFERSPMYHALALGDYLLAIALLHGAGRAAPGVAIARVSRMAAALAVLSREDGRLHLFNDAADGIAPPRARLLGLAEQVLGNRVAEPRGAVSLPDAGYYGYVGGPGGDRFLIDCGEPGPAYQPGHAHCDLLSYELDLAGVPVVVDSGVSGYEGDPLREYVRSTRAHNTATLAGCEQSEVWGAFRVARRAQPLDARIEGDSGGIRFEGAYRPYFDRRLVHRRRVEGRPGSWRVADQFTGADAARAVSYLHLHPEFEVEAIEPGRIVARSPRLAVAIEPFGVERVEIARGARDPAQGWYCPEFGVRSPALALELHAVATSTGQFGYRIAALGGQRSRAGTH